MNKNVDDLLAFFLGDLFVTIIAWLHLSSIDLSSILTMKMEFTDLLYKIITTVIVGFAGGFMGLAGKDFYLFFRSKYHEASRKKIFVYALTIVCVVALLTTVLVLIIT